MRAPVAALHPRGTIVACPTCGKRVTCTGRETAILCHDRHRITTMRPVADAPARP